MDKTLYENVINHIRIKKFHGNTNQQDCDELRSYFYEAHILWKSFLITTEKIKNIRGYIEIEFTKFKEIDF